MSGRRRPFNTPAPQAPLKELPLEHDMLLGERLAAEGPGVPTGVPFNPADAVLKPRVVVDHPLVWVIGLHGGAGVSTLVDLIGDSARDGLRSWPQPWNPPASRSVIVARTHQQGLQLAATAAREWASGALPWINLLGLVLVDDGPRPAGQLKDQLTQLAHMTPTCWRIGWHEPWRIEPPSLATASRRTSKTARDIKARALAARNSQH
jgi:hypothetical protein